MPRYRGLLRNERVAIWRRVTTDDGMCGVYPDFGDAPVIPRYLCRIWWPELEKTRQEPGEEKGEGPSMFGDPADVREGDKVVRSSGQSFIVTSVRKPLDGRVMHHQRCLLRRIDGVSKEH